MNEPEPSDKLGALLRGWAERRRRTKDLDALAQRIVAAIGEEASRGSLGSPRPSPDALDRRRPVWNAPVGFTIGAVAVAVVLACWLLVGGNGKRDVPVQDAGRLPPRLAWLDDGQLREKGRLIRELEQMFDRRLQWIAETDGRVLLEVRCRPIDDSAQSSVPLVARIVVVRRVPHQSQATPVWAVDVLARQERMVRLGTESAGLPEEVELRFWAYPVDEEMVAVDSSLSLPGLALAWNLSSVQEFGEPFVVCRVERSGVEYEVFQTVARLDGET
jgi:hypothetical protein